MGCVFFPRSHYDSVARLGRESPSRAVCCPTDAYKQVMYVSNVCMSFAVPFLDFPFYRYQDTPFSTAQQVEMRQDRTASTNKRAPSKIAPRLYLTCLATAKDVKQLAELGITHVVSVIENAPTFPSTHPLRTLHISVSDYDGEDILSHLPATTSFIRGALAESPKNRVMVHCFMGISRSTTVVIAYLIATTKMTPREALATVRSKRPIVCPNRGFMSQLQEYHSKCSNSQAPRGTALALARRGW